MGTSSSLATSALTAAAGSAGWNGASAAANALSVGIEEPAFCVRRARRSIPGPVAARTPLRRGPGRSSSAPPPTGAAAARATALPRRRRAARRGWRPAVPGWAGPSAASAPAGQSAPPRRGGRRDRRAQQIGERDAGRSSHAARRCDIHTRIDAALARLVIEAVLVPAQRSPRRGSSLARSRRRGRMASPHGHAASTFSRASHGRLTAHDLGRFPGESLFDRIARAVCAASACRARSCTKPGRWRGASGACAAAAAWSISGAGTGCSPTSCCCSTTARLKRSSSTRRCHLHTAAAPGARRFGRGSPGACPSLVSTDEVAAGASDLIVSCHGCGRLTDAALDLAIAARARVAVLPCCHDHVDCETGGWLGGCRPIWRSTRPGRRDFASTGIGSGRRRFRPRSRRATGS